MNIVDLVKIIELQKSAFTLLDEEKNKKSGKNESLISFLKWLTNEISFASSEAISDEVYIDFEEINLQFQGLSHSNQDVVFKQLSGSKTFADFSELLEATIVPESNDNEDEKELRELLSRNQLNQEVLNDVFTDLASKQASVIVQNRLLQVQKHYLGLQLRQIFEFQPEVVSELRKMQSYTEYANKIYSLMNDINREALTKHLKYINQRLFFTVEPQQRSVLGASRNQSSEELKNLAEADSAAHSSRKLQSNLAQESLRKLFPEDLESLVVPTEINRMLVSYLEKKTNEIKGIGYKLKRFIGFGVAQEDEKYNLYTMIKNHIVNVNPVSASETINFLTFIASEIKKADPSALVPLMAVQRVLYNGYLISTDRSPERDIQAFVSVTAHNWRQRASEASSAAKKANTWYQSYFKNNVVASRDVTLKELNSARKKLTELGQRPKEYIASCLQYLHTLQTEISKIETLYRANNISLQDPFIEHLRSEFDTFIQKTILENKHNREMNTALNFDAELATIIYPLYKKVVPETKPELKTLRNYISEYFGFDDDDFARVEQEYDGSIGNGFETILQKFRDTAEDVQQRKVKEVRATESSADINNGKKFEGSCKEFYKALNNRFKLNVKAIKLAQNTDIATNETKLSKQYSKLTSTIVSLVTNVPSIGKTLAQLVEKAGKMAQKKAEKAESKNKESTAEHFQERAISAISEYVARHLTQMLEQQINLLDESALDTFIETVTYRLIASMGDPKLKHLFKSEPLEIALTKAMFLSNQKTGYLHLKGTSVATSEDRRAIMPESRVTAEGFLRQAGIVVERVSNGGNIIREYYVGEGCNPAKYGFIRGDEDLAVNLLHYQKKTPEEAQQHYGNKAKYTYNSAFSGFKGVRDKDVEKDEVKAKHEELEARIQRMEQSHQATLAGLMAEIGHLRSDLLVLKKQQQLPTKSQPALFNAEDQPTPTQISATTSIGFYGDSSQHAYEERITNSATADTCPAMPS